jgi:hypothetical protein
MMGKQNDIIDEIRIAEELRAKKIKQDKRLGRLVKKLRQEYIADGFLMPLYERNGGYALSLQRIYERGNYILSDETLGEEFHRGNQKDWIHQEAIWFWMYLINGQEYVFKESIEKLPEPFKIPGMPAEPVWHELTDIVRQMRLYGEGGGGLIFSANDMDENHLARIVTRRSNEEDEDGYLSSFTVECQPAWITLFHQYKEFEHDSLGMEIRPAWFHLANYAFFNAELSRLPVFLCVFKKGKFGGIIFLEECLSDQARKIISEKLTNIPINVKSQSDLKSIQSERKEMTYWLWHHIGRMQTNQKLSYGQIALITKLPRSTIQSAVSKFDRKLREKLDNKLLERILRTGRDLGLGYNLIYQALVKQNLVPPREIDGFDSLGTLLKPPPNRT